MSKTIREIDELIEEVRKLQIRPVLNTYIHSKDDLIQGLMSIKLTIQKESRCGNES